MESSSNLFDGLYLLQRAGLQRGGGGGYLAGLAGVRIRVRVRVRVLRRRSGHSTPTPLRALDQPQPGAVYCPLPVAETCCRTGRYRS